MGIFSWIKGVFVSDDVIDDDIVDVYYVHEFPKAHEEIMAELRVEERDTVDNSKVIVGDREMSMEQANKLLGHNPKADSFVIPGQIKNGQSTAPAPRNQPVQPQAQPQQVTPQVQQRTQQVPVANVQPQMNQVVDKKTNEFLDYVVIETDEKYAVCISLPGISQPEIANGLIKIDFTKDTLKLSAKLPNLSDVLFTKLKGNSKKTKKSLVNQESSTFNHVKTSKATIKFSKTIDPKIEAKFEDGCLFIYLPIMATSTDSLNITIM
jgi:HSP20 family molecular chaperone IbpA